MHEFQNIADEPAIIGAFNHTELANCGHKLLTFAANEIINRPWLGRRWVSFAADYCDRTPCLITYWLLPQAHVLVGVLYDFDRRKLGSLDTQDDVERLYDAHTLEAYRQFARAFATGEFIPGVGVAFGDSHGTHSALREIHDSTIDKQFEDADLAALIEQGCAYAA